MLASVGNRCAATLAFLLVTCGLCGAQARTTVKFYRYEVATNTGDKVYRQEISSAASRQGGYYRLEIDEQGRILRESYMRNGEELSSKTFHYSGTESSYDSAEVFTRGEKTGIVRCERNSWGLMTRIVDQTAQGVLTAYSVQKGTPLHIEVWDFDGKEQRKGHSIIEAATSGVILHAIVFSSPSSDTAYTERFYAEQTGQVTSAWQFKDGEQINTRKYTYGADGDLSRMDVFDENGKWYAAEEYADELRRKKLYKFANGDTQEIRYSYDAHRWLAKSEVHYNGKFVCSLTYDREPDGTAQRTWAIGPDGTLWAEYPSMEVVDIDRQGQPPNRNDAIIHKSGYWW
jgi:hypothetical protein